MDKKKTELGFIHRFLPSNNRENRSNEKKIDRPLSFYSLVPGGDEGDLIPLENEIAPEAAILSPRGKVLEKGMPRFFRRLDEGVFDIEDLKFCTNELADFLNKAS